ncbi:PTS transporter subunit EIIC [Klebsiella pneumoniae]|nr:PTS transporter subunit EIIC [Klebsiella pneumoniae]
MRNKVSAGELPGALSVCGGAKLTLVAMTPVDLSSTPSPLPGFGPRMTPGISALTGFMKNAGVAGVFVYGFFEKFLIPTGLHHFVTVPLPAHPDWRHAEHWMVRWSPAPRPYSSPICAIPT